jgi:hypothetical protein
MLLIRGGRRGHRRRAIYDERTVMGPRAWDDEGSVDGEDAKTRSSGDRVEALWGGEGRPDGTDHAHIVTNDRINASFLRDPGGEIIVDDNPQSSTYTGYSESSSDRREQNEAMIQRIRDEQRRNRRGGRR